MDRSEERQPLVSIIVPIYNGGELLRSTLDTLVNQTYANIEIVAVNNSSTDNTLAILEEYQAAYPQLFKIYTIPFEQYPGGTKNFGYSIATGDYLYCCEADDLMQYKAVEKLMETALEGDFDVVKAPCYNILDGRRRLVHTIQNGLTPEAWILQGNYAFYSNLIKRSFYHEHLAITKEYNSDDLVYHCTSIAHAEKIGYCDYPVYFYFRRDSCMLNNVRSTQKILGIFDAAEYVLTKNDSKNADYVLFFILRFLLSNISSQFVYADHCIELLKKYWPIYRDNPYLQLQKGFCEKVQHFVDLPDIPMENIVYISGFGSSNWEERAAYLKEEAFYNGCQVIVLDEGNCDVHKNATIEKAYKEENFEFVAGYFALEKIYETGGIYLHDCIQLDAPLNFVRYFPCFFSYLNRSEYSDKIWGGMAGNPVIKSILETYQSAFYADPFYPLDQRIKNILTAQLGIPLSGRTVLFSYDAVVFAPDVMVYNITDGIGFGSRLHLCTHDFSQKANLPEYTTLPRKTLQHAFGTGGTAANGREARQYRQYYFHYVGLRSWQKFLVLFIMNRGLCKAKVSKNLAGHPHFLGFLKGCYRFLKKIKNLLIRK